MIGNILLWNRNKITKINYPREIIPICYGIRSDFIEYDKICECYEYKYDIIIQINNSNLRLQKLIFVISYEVLLGSVC